MTWLCCEICTDYLKFGKLPEGSDLIYEIRKQWRCTDYQFRLVNLPKQYSIDPCQLCGSPSPGHRSSFDTDETDLNRRMSWLQP